MVPSRAIDFPLPKSPDRTVAHPISYTVGTWGFVLAVKRPGLEGDTHFLLVPKLETREHKIPIPPMPLWLAQGQIFLKLYIGAFSHTQHTPSLIVCYLETSFGLEFRSSSGRYIRN
jgi:hypothetical protein